MRLDYDYKAPKIRIRPGANEAECFLNVTWEVVASPDSAAVEIGSNQALLASLMPGDGTTTETEKAKPLPPGKDPADWYYPKPMRDMAPVITMDGDSKVSVCFEEINPLVGGVSANAAKKASIAFWK